MSDTIFHQRYLDALSLPKGTSAEAAPEVAAHKAALIRAHEMRKFEIENYWKRATYFWAFQVAAFALMGLIWKEVATEMLDRLALLLPAALGAISAQVGYLSARGSKFWQENWEAHVDMLEGEVEGRLTQTILYKKHQQFSVSRANLHFTALLILGWVGTFVVILFPGMEQLPTSWVRGMAGLGLLSAMVWVAIASMPTFTGWVFSAGAMDWMRTASNKEPKLRILIRDANGIRADEPKPARAPRTPGASTKPTRQP